MLILICGGDYVKWGKCKLNMDAPKKKKSFLNEEWELKGLRDTKDCVVKKNPMIGKFKSRTLTP